ncbi:four-helix bundle copper-binding protein [Radiobacillus sp. PE A8.2]|uniref:four-helix bundle copper-binding protein n=1 Tax=Radiobacillus sp. PE A8.2 TaxID=3380349 RepID=UPI00388FAFDD
MEQVKGHAMELCFEAARLCEKTYAVALDMKDTKLIRYLRDCADLCYTCGEFCARDSEFMGALSKACADTCVACADLCDTVDKEVAKECAKACRDCADACQKVS